MQISGRSITVKVVCNSAVLLVHILVGISGTTCWVTVSFSLEVELSAQTAHIKWLLKLVVNLFIRLEKVMIEACNY